MNQFIQFLTNYTSACLVLLSFDRFYSCCNSFTVDWATGFWDFHVCIESTKTFVQQKQANLGQFSIFSIQNWTIVCLNQPHNWLVPFYCTYLSSDSPKKAFVFENSAWSSMIWIVLYSNFLFLYSLNGDAN